MGSAALSGCSNDTGDAGGTTTTAPESLATSSTMPAPDLPGDPFRLGVASGDPLVDRVVLWTRLVPDEAPMPADDVPVIWEMATSDTFEDIVATGTAVASAAHAHAVHVDADGLEADSWFSYRFRVGEWTSPAGRTRTVPAADVEADELRMGMGSCQHFEVGYYNAYRDVVATDVDLFVFLGDYIYEYAANSTGNRPRLHEGPEITDLDSYRARYAQYRGDEWLQAAHAHCPWVVVWDDHEVENDHAANVPEDGSDSEAFDQRRAAAYKAWWEHMPVRMDPPSGPALRIHRSIAFGKLAQLLMIDTRQFRDIQACDVDGVSLEPACDEVYDPTRSMTGDEQEQWLIDGLTGSDATWNVIGNQTVMTELTVGDAILNYDQWDGYPANRDRIMGAVADAGLTNTVVVTGDIHVAGVGDVVVDDQTVATELVCPGISSLASFPDDLIDLAEQSLPDVRYLNARHRGWTFNRITPEGWTAEFRAVEDNLVDGSPTTVDATFAITPDRPGAERVS